MATISEECEEGFAFFTSTLRAAASEFNYRCRSDMRHNIVIKTNFGSLEKSIFAKRRHWLVTYFRGESFLITECSSGSFLTQTVILCCPCSVHTAVLAFLTSHSLYNLFHSEVFLSHKKKKARVACLTLGLCVASFRRQKRLLFLVRSL